MIVTCVQCDTQFRLDDAKVSSSGLNVRCSICKHAFFVAPPSATPVAEDAPADPKDRIERIADAAIEAALFEEPSPTPQITRDLSPAGDSSPELSDDTEAALEEWDKEWDNEKGLAGEEESDWEFNSEQDPPTEGAPIESAREAAAPPTDDSTAEGENAVAGDRLGNPADWDFFGAEGDDFSATPEESRSQEGLQGAKSGPGGGRSAFGESPLSAEQADAQVAAGIGSEAQATPTEPPMEVGREVGFGRGSGQSTGAVDGTLAPLDSDTDSETLESRLPAAVRRVAEAIGWLSVIALFTVGLHAGLKLRPTLPSVASQPVAGVVAESIEARWIENILAGPLYVVTGSLRNPGEVPTAPGTLIALRLYDASGRPLDGPSATLGPALSERQIREADPDELEALLAVGAARRGRSSLAPGQRYRFHAIWRDIPAAAASFRFESAPLSLPGSGAEGGRGSVAGLAEEEKGVIPRSMTPIGVGDARNLRPAASPR